jgi:hypothetical protein
MDLEYRLEGVKMCNADSDLREAGRIWLPLRISIAKLFVALLPESVEAIKKTLEVSNGL